jgi:MFS family permease
MASDPHKTIRNDNLRLVLSEQEGAYIRTSLQKKQRQILFSTVFVLLCAFLIFGGPIISTINSAFFNEYLGWFSSAFFLGILLAPIAALSLIFSGVSFYRYKNMHREHNSFLAGYGRKHSD